VAGPGAGPFTGIGALLLQAGEAASPLDAGKVTAFIVDWSRDCTTGSAKAMVTSLRAFLRFAHATGRTAVPLAGSVPAVASWRLAPLPQVLKAADIEMLLAGCDRETAVGLRDHAVLSLLARLGLRGAEAFPEATAFLVNSCGRPLRGTYLPHVFAPLAEQAGIQAPPGQRAPRLHDLRHVFAVTTLLDWYRDGGDVQARLLVLSTWLGHVDPKSTYWYLQAVPELLALAAARFEPAGEEAAQ
jgi:integrase